MCYDLYHFFHSDEGLPIFLPDERFLNLASLSAYSFASPSDPTNIITSGPNVIPNLNFESSVDFRVGDTIILTNDPDANGASFVDHEVRIRIEAPLPLGAPPVQNGYNFSVLSIDSNVGTSAVDWSVRLEQSKSI